MLIIKVINLIVRLFSLFFGTLVTQLLLILNRVSFSSFKSFGVPFVNVNRHGKMVVGSKFVCNNTRAANPIGRNSKCSFVVGKGAELRIGNNVGVSSVAIVCQNSISIGNNVKIGGNVVIYDTDFHSLKAQDRLNRISDEMNTKTKAVFIADNVFIGAHSTILKGVSIGKNVVIGANSVVTRSIPESEIWAGIPARKIGSC